MDALQPEPTSAAGWFRWLPGIATLRSYQAHWLVRDLGAGLVLTTALAPVGIAYAVASGLPGACGLYATIVPLIAYALFGPSRILVLGPDSSLAAIILGVVAPLAAGDANRAVALAGMMAIVSGAVCVLAGVVRLGFVTELLSKPIRYGYMNGIALAVLVSQTPKLIGVKIDNAGPLRDVWSIGAEIVGGRVNWVAFALGAATLATILSVRTFKGTPSVLIAVIGATAVVTFSAWTLVELDDTLRDKRTKLCFAELKDPVKDKLKRLGFFDKVGEAFFFATIGAAVDEYQATHRAEWIVGADSAGERP